jgi:hypothetical protein
MMRTKSVDPSRGSRSPLPSQAAVRTEQAGLGSEQAAVRTEQAGLGSEQVAARTEQGKLASLEERLAALEKRVQRASVGR